MTTHLQQVNAGRASGVARRQRIAAEAKRREIMDRVIGGSADLIPDLAYTTAVELMGQILEAEGVPVDTALDRQRTAETVKTLFAIARLASGESTSNVASVTMTGEDALALKSRLANLRPGDRRTEAVDIPTDEDTRD